MERNLNWERKQHYQKTCPLFMSVLVTKKLSKTPYKAKANHFTKIMSFQCFELHSKDTFVEVPFSSPILGALHPFLPSSTNNVKYSQNIHFCNVLFPIIECYLCVLVFLYLRSLKIFIIHVSRNVVSLYRVLCMNFCVLVPYNLKYTQNKRLM